MENEMLIVNKEEIKDLIYTVRGKQVMLDSDVAILYQYTTKNINKAVKRNRERFPEEFCFQLTDNEFENLRFQIGTSKQSDEVSNNLRGGRRYLPYVFTEQGIAMLSGVLKSEVAIKVSIHIIKAFIEMRKFISLNGQVFQEISGIKGKLLEYDKKFDEIFDELQNKKQEEFKQKIFFGGQIYDAYSLIIDIIKTARNKILIIDNYINDSVLKMLAKKNKEVEVVILTSKNTELSKLDINKFNGQYPTLKLAITNHFHDRFMVIDDKELYHIGASLKNLGKKCFAISKVENQEMIDLIKKAS